LDVTTGEFTADLNDLRIIGAMDLPMLGYTYAMANNAVAGTVGADILAFAVEDGGPPSVIADVWIDLRNELQKILGLTAENMLSAGRIVLHIAQAYEDTDTAVGAAIRAAWQGGMPPDTVGGERIPPEPPAVKPAAFY
jgi:hypothetical protein